MTKELRRLSFVILAMFVSLFVASSWIQVVDADNLAQNPANTRTRLDSYQIQRGSIIVDDTAIATSIPASDRYQYQRVYSDAEMWAPVTGYFNPALQSSTGIENAFNADLSGTGSNAFFSEIERIFSGQSAQGLSVKLTLDAKAQRAAWEGLQGLQGAVVAIEPATGRILAMASTPGFDTNTLASHDTVAVDAEHDRLAADPRKPLYNRAIAGNLNPPGSTFKVVVAAAALASGDWTLDSTLPNPARYALPDTIGREVSNAWGGTCGDGKTTTLAQALKLSCNIPMAELAVELGDDAIRETAEKFGFNTDFEIPLAVTPSSYPEGLDAPQTALSGFGQGKVTATPLQMAMVSAGVGNGGAVMKPRMADAVIGDDFAVHKQFTDEAFEQVLDAEQARALTAVLVEGVESGAATGARIDGVDVAGKTGTAENGGKPYTLWFTGFAPAENPTVAVAVVVEDGGGKGQSGSGNAIAAPIAKKVIEAVLGK
ncbi:Cell division protein FtsI [Peptidoglycan synthetase] [Microbacterium esteraromaticum]|uniref:Cell division protein FtsI [Peptidoglycan synthetase] n=1 Tax=Microbacterium esteraromaticum TaxID=57043 RepID=A0A1R4JYQ7_9MICO|nr:penicillin-binding transpeptidase domain-containing protein [Microbacterium esteraromaticum]SJN37220.1 Cell division protein FtsI [Peptidoglycan synthetase] [Microbacterium esteraromaticum]